MSILNTLVLMWLERIRITRDGKKRLQPSNYLLAESSKD